MESAIVALIILFSLARLKIVNEFNQARSNFYVTPFRDFLKKYKVISNKGASVSPERAVISLLEGTGEQLSPSVVERVVEEQLRLMREGDGKDEAMAAAVSQVNATDDSITIQPLASSLR